MQLVARKPDWRNVDDYAFTENLDRTGWAWEFLRRNPEYKSDYAAMIDSQSDLRKATPHLRTGSDVVEHGPDVISAEEALGIKWGMERAVDPNGDRRPTFSSIYPKEIGWPEVADFYQAEDDEAPATQVAPFLIMAFDLSADVTSQLERTRDILMRRREDSTLEKSFRKRSEWRTYLRLLDAGELEATKDIIGHISDYQQIENEVETGYKATDRVSDQKKSARLLRDNPLRILEKKEA